MEAGCACAREFEAPWKAGNKAIRKEENEKNYLVRIDFTNLTTNSIKARCGAYVSEKKA